jgi:hypothetical protein
MSKPKLFSAALIAAALLATPALARENHVTSRQITENAAANAIGERHREWRPCYSGGLRGEICNYGYRDVWGHWGGYYGPMIGGR